MQGQNFNLFGGGGEPEPRRSTFFNSSADYGATWFNQPISINNDFDFLYSVNFGCINNSGDGLAFVLSQNPDVSSVSGGMGYLGLSDVLAVEFDLQQDIFDPNYDHVAITLNGVVSHNSSNNLAGPAAILAGNTSVEDCSFHSVRIKWDASIFKLTVFVDCNEVISHTFTIAELSQAFTSPNNIYVGYTASRFTGSNNYTVDWLSADFGLPARNVEFCQGDTAELTFTGGSYSFDSGSGLINPSANSDVVQFYQQQDEYVFVNASNSCGDSWTDTVIVDVLERPNVQLGADTGVCSSDTFWLDVSEPNATQYSWSTGHSGPQLAPSQTGIYSVTVTNSVCAASDTMSFERLEIPEISLGNDTSICFNSSFLIHAGSSSNSYSWNTGNASHVQEVNGAGLFIAEASNACGSVTDSINVTTYPRIQFDLGSDTTICEGENIVLDASTNGLVNYLWNTGSIQPGIQISNPGLYSVQVSNNCESKVDEIEIEVMQLPDLSHYVDTFFCAGSSLKLNPPASVDDYSWTVSESSGQLEIAEPGIYGISANNFCGETTTSFSVIELTEPEVNLGADTVLCEGEFVDVNVGGAFTSVLWSDGDTNSSRRLDQEGIYSVSLFNGCGGDSDNFRIEYDSLPRVSLPESRNICDGNKTKIVASIENVRSILWSTGESNNNAISVSEEGTYSVEVSNFCGSDQASTFINIRENPELNIDLDTAMCPGEYLKVDLSNLEGTIDWSNGNTGRVGMLESPGNYEVIYTDDYGCSAKDSVHIRSECPTKLFMPSAFTPNGDGLNDVFSPEGEWVHSFSMEVFNRWGELIHQSYGFDNGWNGEGQPEGIYVWRVQYEDQSFVTHQLQGKVTLTRSVQPQP